jgi:hypothetical protein
MTEQLFASQEGCSSMESVFSHLCLGLLSGVSLQGFQIKTSVLISALHMRATFLTLLIPSSS